MEVEKASKNQKNVVAIKKVGCSYQGGKHKFVHVGTHRGTWGTVCAISAPTRTSTTVGTVGRARTCTDYRYQKKMRKQLIYVGGKKRLYSYQLA